MIMRSALRCCLILIALLAICECGSANDCQQSRLGFIWAQAQGNHHTRSSPDELFSVEFMTGLANNGLAITLHNITDLLFAACNPNDNGLDIAPAYAEGPPPSRILILPITLPTEVIRMPSLRKRLLAFYRNVSVALSSTYVIAWAPYQTERVPTGIEDIAELVNEIWVGSASHVKQLVDRDVPAESIHMMGLGIDVSRYGPHVEKAQLPLPSGCQYVVMGITEGRFGSGVDVLTKGFIQAFSNDANPVHASTCLVLIDVTRESSYDLLQSIVNEAFTEAGGTQAQKDRVVIAHADPSDPKVSKARLLAAADVVVMPSRDGVVGLTIMEAMAAGKMVITTQTGGNVYQLQNGARLQCTATTMQGLPQTILGADERAGLHVGSNICEPNIGNLVALLQATRADSERSAQMGQVARETAVREFDAAKVASRIRQRLEQLPGELYRC